VGTPQEREDRIDSDEIEEVQQDENLTPADRMDLIANAVAKDEDSARDHEASEAERNPGEAE